MRGFWFMVEAAMAGIILVAFVSLLVSPNLSENDDLTARAFLLLHGLNKQGLLKGYAAEGNHTAINRLIIFFPANHSVQICTPEECSGPAPSGSNVWAGSYIVPGYGKYNPREVKLYLFR